VKVRLKPAGIFTPLDFLEAPMQKLKEEVFKSSVGYYWYLRLRGYEIDAQKFPIRSFGNDFAIKEWTRDREEISRYMMKLAEKTGRRLRRHDYQAHGVYLGLAFDDRTWWGKSRRVGAPIYSTQEIYLSLVRLLDQAELVAK